MLTGIEHIHGREPPCWIGGHRHQHPVEPLGEPFDGGRVEQVGVEFDAKAQLVARTGLQCQWVVGGFAGGELGDGQLVGAGQRAGVDRVVLVDEQGVEQVVVAGDAVDLTERQVLVVECLVVGAVQLVEQVGGGGCRCDVRAHRHRVDQQAHHRFGAGQLGWAPRDRGAEDDIVLAGQPHQQLRPGALQHGIERRVVCPCQLAEGARGVLGHPERFNASGA